MESPSSLLTSGPGRTKPRVMWIKRISHVSRNIIPETHANRTSELNPTSMIVLSSETRFLRIFKSAMTNLIIEWFCNVSHNLYFTSSISISFHANSFKITIIRWISNSANNNSQHESSETIQSCPFCFSSVLHNFISKMLHLYIHTCTYMVICCYDFVVAADGVLTIFQWITAQSTPARK